MHLRVVPKRHSHPPFPLRRRHSPAPNDDDCFVLVMVVDGEHFLEIGVGVGVISVVVMNDDAREKAFGRERERRSGP